MPFLRRLSSGPPDEPLGPMRAVPPSAASAKPERAPDTLPPQPTVASTSDATVRFEPPPGGIATASLTLELLCDAPGALILYALDADDVDQNGTYYDPEEKILLARSTSIAARAFHNGALGPLATARYEVARPGWQVLEPADQTDPAPHQLSENALCEDGWQIAAASIRGKLHAHRGSWREDSFAIASAGAWSIIAVADGAGSAELSRVGSRLACEAALASLAESLAEQVLGEDEDALTSRDLPIVREKLVEAAKAAMQAVAQEAENREKRPSDLAATLLILVRAAWREQQVCGGLQVGDGAIALLDGDGSVGLLGVADHGEHSSETRFLSTHGIEAELYERVQFAIRSDLRAVAVMSDGVSDDFFPEVERLPMVFAQVLPRVQSAEDADSELLGWIGYEKRGSSDDRTLVVSWRGEPQAASTSAAPAVAQPTSRRLARRVLRSSRGRDKARRSQRTKGGEDNRDDSGAS